jgi:uncharacterized UPF0146 family protein
MTLEDNLRDYSINVMSTSKKGLLNLDTSMNYWGNIAAQRDYLIPLYNIFKEGMSMVNLGSGTGSVLRFSKNIGYEVLGVEMDKNLIKHSIEPNVIEGNILELESSFFKEFDVIYSYRPLKKEFKEFIDNVIDNMKEGAYIVTPHFSIENNKVKQVDNFTYIK